MDSIKTMDDNNTTPTPDEEVVQDAAAQGHNEENDGMNAVNNIITAIKNDSQIYIDRNNREELKIINYNITMINSDYKIGFKVDRDKLFKLLLNVQKAYVTYDPSIYQGVKISYMWNKGNKSKDGVCKCNEKCSLLKQIRKRNNCKIVTIAIFQDRSIIITGANSLEQINEAYNYVNKILYSNYEKIAQFSILDF